MEAPPFSVLFFDTDDHFGRFENVLIFSFFLPFFFPLQIDFFSEKKDLHPKNPELPR